MFRFSLAIDYLMNSPPTTSCMCVLVTLTGKKTVEMKAPSTAPDRKSDRLISSGDDRNCGGSPSRIRSLGRETKSYLDLIKNTVIFNPLSMFI